MSLLQEQFRYRAYHRRLFYDVYAVGVLVVLTVLLLPAWKMLGGGESVEVVSLLADPMMPAAMGFLLALRYGTIDMSLWANMGLGGVVGASLILAGLSPAWAIGGAIGAGMGVGAINALILARFHIPGLLLTLLTGVACLAGMWALCPAGDMQIPENTFDPWVAYLVESFGLEPDKGEQLIAPMATIRMAIVMIGWAGLLVVLLVADIKTAHVPRPFTRWWIRPASLIVSGGLAALSGVAWLIEHGRTPVPTRLIDGVGIPVGVILAGTLLLRGRGRTMLAGISLPVAMLLVHLWKQSIWPWSIQGYSITVVTLGVLVLGAQLAFVCGLDHPRKIRWGSWSACGLLLGGLFVIASTGWQEQLATQPRFFWGSVIASAGLVLLGGSYLATLYVRKHGDDQKAEQLAYDFEDVETKDDEFLYDHSERPAEDE